MKRRWVVAKVGGGFAKVVDAESDQAAVWEALGGHPQEGVFQVWRLGNFPAEYQVAERPPSGPDEIVHEIRYLGRPGIAP